MKRRWWREAHGWVKQFAENFSDDRVMASAAAIAFYAALSFGPLLLSIVYFGSWFGAATEARLVDEVRALLGPEAASSVDVVLQNADRSILEGGGATRWVSLAVLLFSAASVFAHVQNAMNVIWNVEAKPGRGILLWLRARIFSMGLVLSTCFLLMVALVFDAIASAFLPSAATPAGSVLRFAGSLVPFTVLFALVFRYLPDARIPWRQVWIGAAITAVLFGVGKGVVGAYLGRSAIGSMFGAAGALVALLVWVYYASIILLVGAEITATYARETPGRIQPSRFAARVDG